ncbi:MAG: gamma-glutamyl-gamma-aminobutyrate hydrolase family protein, partial [Bacteroidota bacterium]|nr:gamma-glutamyl-gamma-aminobutyrate hydrolase family protein [Bacteroidota bacterium]
FKKLFDNSEGIIFFGGPDLPPITYKENKHLLTNVSDRYRHYFELSFIFHLLDNEENKNYTALLEDKPNYVIYGFCLGMQTMNIATGGKMCQDIPSKIYNSIYAQDIVNLEINKQHRNYYKSILQDPNYFNGNFHKINIIENKFTNTNLTKDFTPTVYSNHHQAVSKTGKGFYVIARSLDEEIIEAVAHKKYPNVLGVQFHPEGKYLYNNEKHKQKPKDNPTSGKEILQKNNSYQFHLDFWMKFNNLF